MTITEIALDIADESECSVVETSCLITILDGVEWYDTKQLWPYIDRQLFGRAFGYLKLRGLLTVHEDFPHLVRIGCAAGLGQQALEFLAPL